MLHLIESIVDEWSKNIPSGIIDMEKEEHLYELLQILGQKIDNPQIVRAVMENIREQMRERY